MTVTTDELVVDDEIVIDDDDEALVFDDEEVLDDDSYTWPNGPKLSADEYLIHTRLTATMLRALLEGVRFTDERELLKLDAIMKPLIKLDVRPHPHNIEATRVMFTEDLRELGRLISERLA